MRFAPLLLLAACGGHYRTEIVGQGSLGGSVQLARGSYDLVLDLETPRAQVVEWSMSCAGIDVGHGSVGEPFEQYRARRIAELKKDRENERAVAAGVTSLIVGAVAPRAKAGPVTASVDPNAAGAVVAASIDDRVELPPGDVGAGKLSIRAHLSPQSDGPCTVGIVADDPTVRGNFRITQLHDLDAEAHERVVVANAAAVQLRTRISTQLVTLGADGEARERRRLAFEAEAERRHRAVEQEAARRQSEADRERLAFEAAAERRHLEAERLVAIRIAGEAAHRHELEVAIAQQRQVALDARVRIYGVLVMWGADEGLHTRRQAELQLRIDLERQKAEAAWEVHLRAERARIAIAMTARANLRGFLIGLGAVEKSPMPEPRIEEHAVAPFEGAVWIEGHWTWYGTSWQWTHGGWKDPGHFGETGGSIAVVAPRPVVVEDAPPPAVVVVTKPTPPTIVVGTPRPPTVVVTVPVPTIVIHTHEPHVVHRAPPPKRKTDRR